MAAVVREESAWTETRVVGAQELLHEFRAEESERILERLNGRARAEDRRSGRDRRSTAAQNTPAGGEERRRGERRSGRDRRFRRVA